jgi:DNA-binding XRE family transcriptional regulator
MAVPKEATSRDITGTVPIDFDAVKARAAEILNVPFDSVTQQMLADLFGSSRKTIGRYKAGKTPAFRQATAMSRILGLPVEKITGTPAVGAER